MKNLFLALILLFTINAFAQDDDSRPTDKGQFLVNGGLTFNTSKLESSSSFTEAVEGKRLIFSLSPKAGYFIVNGLALGLKTNFTYNRSENDNADGSNIVIKNTNFTAGPFVRYYLKNGLFSELSVGFGQQNWEVENEFGGETDVDFFSYEFGIGYAIFFNNSVSLEPFLSYQFDRQTQDESEVEISGLNLGVGFTFYF